MMARADEPFRFFVEGSDDFHAILHLLRQHNLSRETTPQFPPFRPPKDRPPEDEDDGESRQGKRSVLDAVETDIKANPNNSVGFVLDADDDVQGSWDAVAHRLNKVDVDVSAGISPQGFLGRSSDYGTRVGVWLMPDNERDGELEDFLEDLVDEDNLLFPYAFEATRCAKSRGATFPDGKTGKAVLHTWLAWQEEPGRPYGRAIGNGYLRHDSDAALRFVAWFRQLFALDV